MSIKDNKLKDDKDWEFVERKTLSAATNTTFSGLNSVRDKEYKIKYRLMAATGVNYLVLQPNAGNVGTYSVHWAGVVNAAKSHDVENGNGMCFDIFFANTDYSKGKLELDVENGFMKQGTFHNSHVHSVGNHSVTGHCYWNDTSTVISSLKILSGSNLTGWIELYRRK